MDRPSGFLPSNILNFARHNHFESWSLSSRGGGDSHRFERVFIPELLWIHLCEMACSIGRYRVFFRGLSPELPLLSSIKIIYDKIK